MENPIRSALRRRLKISVRALLLLVLTLGGWLGWTVRRAHVQRQAVAALEEARFTVLYDWEWKDGARNWDGQPWAPKALVKHLGADYFGRVRHASHWGWVNHSGACSDQDLFQLGRLTDLVSVKLVDSYATDEGLGYLKRLTRLEELEFGSGSRITDAGLVHLRGMTRLRTLDISQSHRVTDAGVRRLREALPNLKVIR